MPKMELQKHTLNLRKGDFQAIADAYVGTGMDASTVIRLTVANLVDRLNAPTEQVELPHIEGVDL